ncbi:hypothetical protein Tco_0692162 [Tanacetum coccineum]
MENDIVKLVVEIESFGMSSDEFDKETVSSDGLQPKQADLKSYISFPTLVDDCQHPKESLCQQELYIPIRVNEARGAKDTLG